MADLQAQAASPSDLQISPDFPKRKSDQRNRSFGQELGLGQKAAGYTVICGTSLEENYFLTSGDGSYMIRDHDGGSNSATDTFEFVDLNSTGVDLARGTSNDLIMTTDFGETVTIDNYFDTDYDYLMDQIVFADGVTMGLEDVNVLTIA